MRLNDVVVNETPKFQCPNPTNLSHTITFKGENMNDELIIYLDLRGVVSCFTTRKPKQKEIDTCDWYEMTYESPVYDPSGSEYAEQEAVMMDSRGQLNVADDKHLFRRQICPGHMAETFSDKTIKLQALSLTLDARSLLQEMTSHVYISEVNMSSLTNDMRDGGGVDTATLENNFGIGIERPREHAS
jgi:hypothetical protein